MSKQWNLWCVECMCDCACECGVCHIVSIWNWFDWICQMANIVSFFLFCLVDLRHHWIVEARCEYILDTLGSHVDFFVFNFIRLLLRLPWMFVPIVWWIFPMRLTDLLFHFTSIYFIAVAHQLVSLACMLWLRAKDNINGNDTLKKNSYQEKKIVRSYRNNGCGAISHTIKYNCKPNQCILCKCVYRRFVSMEYICCTLLLLLLLLMVFVCFSLSIFF